MSSVDRREANAVETCELKIEIKDLSAVPRPSIKSAGPLPQDLINLLYALPFFPNNEANNFLETISRYLTIRKYDAGDLVIRCGDVSKAMFFTLKGTLVVTSDDSEIELAELESVGEIALLYNVKRTANVMAKTACTLGVLSADSLNQALGQFVDVAKLMKQFAQSRAKLLQQEYLKMGKSIHMDIQNILQSEDLEFNSCLTSSTRSTPTSNKFASELKSSPENDSLGSISAKPNRLAVRLNEKRRLSVAVWSDAKLMQLAENIQNTQKIQSKLALKKSNDSFGASSQYKTKWQGQGGLFVLDEELIARIFRFLPFSDIFRIRRVCKIFRQIIVSQDYELLRNVDLTDFNKKITDVNLFTIAKIGSSTIIALILKNCWNISNQGLIQTFKEVPNVLELNLHSLWNITDDSLVFLAEVCKNLEVIDLSNCRKITAKGLLTLLNSCSFLQSVSLSYCKMLGDEILTSETWKGVKVANFQRCTGITDKGFSSWNTFYLIEELNLSDCSFLTDEAINNITKSCIKLKRLCLSFCCSLSELAIEFIIERMPFLEVLDASFCGAAITDETLGMIAQHPKLAYISFRGCVQITNQGIELLRDMKSLRAINITQCKNIDQAMIKSLNVTWSTVHYSFFDQDKGKPMRSHTAAY